MAVTLHPAPPSAAQSVLSSTQHPASSSLALFPSSAALDGSSTKSRQLVDVAQYGRHAINEEREFIVDTYPLFSSLQKIVGEYEQTLATDEWDQTSLPPPREQIEYYQRISSLYRQAMLKQLSLVQANPETSRQEKQSRAQHYSTMHSILSLTEILYLAPESSGVVGEELLDWLNVVDRSPSAEEGTELSSLAQPWESPDFFPYLTKCLLRGHTSSLVALLNLVLSAPSTSASTTFKELSKLFLDTLATFPRSTQFKQEVEFRSSLTRFKSNAKLALEQAERLYQRQQEEAEDTDDEVVHSFRTLFSILTLPTVASSSSTSPMETLSNHCESWQEFLITSLIYVYPLSTRADLASLVSSHVLAGGDWSVDHTLLEERVQERLFKGDVPGLLKTLVVSGDEAGEGGEDEEEGEWLWLATHLVDLLSHLHLPAFDFSTPTPNRRSDGDGDDDVMDDDAEGGGVGSLGPRESFLLSYADRLIESDESLWRVCCEYWGESGSRVGLRRIENLLSGGGVPVDNDGDAPADEGMQVEEQKQGEEGKRNIEEVLAVLGDYGMEDQVKKVCQSHAESLITKKDYGKAIAYCVRAGDSRKVDRIALKILNEYVDQGQESFIRHVDSLPTSLLRPNSDSTPASPSSSTTRDLLSPLAPPSSHQFPLITFLSRYRDFLALYSLAGSAGHGEEEAWTTKRQASELLILLLTSGFAPRQFWAIMLLDSVGLLESQPLLVTMAETYELMRIVEELTSPIQLSASSSSSPKPVDIFGDLEMLGRLLEGREPSSTAPEGDVGAMRTKRALDQLEIVRGSLARHLALCCCL
ncbi:hypothetical protein JCM11491_002557 [Sporobolomyces phaffii]